MDHNRLGGVMKQLDQAGIGEHIYCVLCRRMAPDQKQIVCKRSKVDTQLFIDVMTWFVKNLAIQDITRLQFQRIVHNLY
jgi:hypothetical protein